MSADRPNATRGLLIIQPIPGDDIPEATRLAASIFGTMLFPGVEDQRQKRLAVSHILALRNKTMFTGSVEKGLDDWMAEPVANRLQMQQVLTFLEKSSWSEISDQWIRGYVAGAVFSFVVWMNQHRYGAGSLGRAFFMVEQLNRYPEAAGINMLPQRMSVKTIQRIWAEFATVSHFWAAYTQHANNFINIHSAQNLESNYDPNRMALDSFISDPKFVIAYSVNYLRYITNHIPTGKKPASPILHWSDAWLPPDDSIPKDRPDFLDPAKVYVGLKGHAAQLFDRYKKKH